MLDYLVGYMGFHGSLLGCKKISQPKTFRLGCFFWPFRGLCGANVGPYGVHVGPMLCHMGSMLGSLEPCWGHVEPMLGQERRGPFGLETRPKGTRLFGGMLGPCWANVGRYGVHVGPMLDSLEPCWGHVEPMLSLCWAKNGVFLLYMYIQLIHVS